MLLQFFAITKMKCLYQYVVLLLFLCSLGCCQNCVNNVEDFDDMGIKIQFYTGPTVTDVTEFSLHCGADIVNSSAYKPELRTVFFLPGWSERPSAHREHESIDIIAKAFLTRNDVNLAVMNYEELVKDKIVDSDAAPAILQKGAGYLQSRLTVEKIGKALGNFYRNFLDRCDCEDKLLNVGFSLGAQILHFAVKSLKRINNNLRAQNGANYVERKIKRITALEAAAPLFELPFVEHLTRMDAQFVDAIHTDGGAMGFRSSYGHVDFFPNSGVAKQPHCVSSNVLKCSHYTSVYYYAESVVRPNAFSAKKCMNDMSFKMNLCGKNTKTYMGYGVNESARGNYYLTTNSDSPYGKDS